MPETIKEETLVKAISKPAPAARRRFPGEIIYQLHQNAPDTLLRLARQGPAVGLKLGRTQALLVSQPDLIHQVLVRQAQDFGQPPGRQVMARLLGQGLLTSQGQLHKSQRQLLQPVFQAQKVGTFADPIVSCSRHVLGNWPEEGVISAAPEMTRLTLQIVGQCLFSTDLEDDVSEVRAALADAMALFRVARLPFALWLERLYPPLRRRLQGSRERLDAVIFRMIEEHQRCPHADLLGRMLQSPMSREQLRDESMTMFLAGHETTAHALTFALYLLSRHSESQAEIRREIERVSGGEGLRLEHLPQLVRTKEALLETLRLYPPAWIQVRQCQRDTTLGDYAVARGCLMLTSQYVMHRHPEFFPEPDRFWPERWQQRPRASLPKGSYFPFGMGPRVCIGEHFAWLEMLLGLGTVLQHYELLACPVANPGLRARVTLAPAQDLPIPVRRLH